MLSAIEVDRIAAMANALRPDWPVASLRTLITTKLSHRTRRDLAVALAWVACDSATEKPGRVLEAGPWWLGFGSEARVARNPKAGEECPKHVGQFAHACGPCVSERLEVGYRPPVATAAPPPPEYQQARKATP